MIKLLPSGGLFIVIFVYVEGYVHCIFAIKRKQKLKNMFIISSRKLF